MTTPKSERVAAAFHVLQVIKKTVDETTTPARDAAADRALADELIAGARGRNSSSGPTRLHALCLRLVEEREMLRGAL